MSYSSLQQLYQQIILDHARTRHGSSTEPLSPLSHSSEAVNGGLRIAESHQLNSTCGDEVTVRVAVSEPVRGSDVVGEGSALARVEEIVWHGEGCSISVASASVLSDTLRGTTVPASRAMLEAFRAMLRSRGAIEPDEEVMGDAAAFAGVSRYPARVKCAMLPWVAFEVALDEIDQ